MLPFFEEDAYKYVAFLRNSGAPPTRATRFREAVAFAKYVVGADGADDVLSSRRVSGAALESWRRKRKLRQRDPLTVGQVKALEAVAAGQGKVMDRVFAGFVLFMLYTRARFNDAMNVTSEPEVVGRFLEAETAKFKTANLPGRRDKVLPLAGPAQGLVAASWAERWLDDRRACGLVAAPGRPFMPAPCADGSWTEGPLANFEATVWMRELLAADAGPPADMDNIGTHSCKVTTLSWMAKAGAKEGDRRLLGYHVAPKSRSVLIYSRDALAGPLRELEKILKCIACGDFAPDADRSGRWVGERPPPPPPSAVPPPPSEAADDVPPPPPPPEQESSDGSSCGSSTASEPDQPSDSDGEAAERAAQAVSVKGRGPARGSSEAIHKHAQRGTFHKGAELDGTRLACGRAVSANFRLVDEIPAFMWPRCQVCFGTRPGGSSEDEV